MVSSSHVVSVTASSSGRGVLIHWPWCLHCCFSHVFSLCSSLATVTSEQHLLFSSLFFPHKCVITEVLLTPLIGLALFCGRSSLELAGNGSVRVGGSFWQLSTEATPVAPPPPVPCHTSPIPQEKGCMGDLGEGRSAGSERIRACAVVTTPLVYLSLPSNRGGKIWRNPSGYHLQSIILKLKLKNEYPESFDYSMYFL